MLLLFAYAVPNGLWLPATLLTLATIIEVVVVVIVS